MPRRRAKPSRRADGALLKQTYALLDTASLSYRAIAVGAAVDKDWLVKLGQRDIGDPGVNKVERVRDFLIAQPGADDRLRSAAPAMNGTPSLQHSA